MLRVADAGVDGEVSHERGDEPVPGGGRYAAIVVGADEGGTPTTAEVTAGEIVLEGGARRTAGTTTRTCVVEFVGPAADSSEEIVRRCVGFYSSRACITPGVGFQDSSSRSHALDKTAARGYDSKIRIASDSPSSPSVRCEGSLAANRSYRRGRKTSRGSRVEGFGRLPSFEDPGDMAKTDATRGHAGGGREPLVDSALSLFSETSPETAAATRRVAAYRSAFLSEFVAKTAASVLPTEPAANARGATASKPQRRKVKFSRHVHGRPLSRRRVANNKPENELSKGLLHDQLTFCLCRLPLHAGRRSEFW